MQNGGFKSLIKGNSGAAGGIDRDFVLGLGLAAIVVITLWWTPVLFPFRIMTTTVHELSHAISVILTGGTVATFDVNWNGSGVVGFTGGFALLIYSAGYLGSTLFGGVMLLIAKNEKGRRDSLRFLAIGLVVVLLVAGILRAIRTGNLFNIVLFTDPVAFILVVGLVALLWFVAQKAPDLLVAFIAYTLALLSCLYAVFDLLNVFTSSVQPWGGFNDARGLQGATGIPAIIWAGVWVVIAGLILWQFFRAAIRRASKSSAGDLGAGSDFKSPLDKYENLFK